MSTFDEKHKELKNRGLDLGAPLAGVEDAGFGGQVRRYEHGHIYHHPKTGTHEVHGGILGVYLQHGGPGVNPSSGRRDFGFPVGDEEVTPILTKVPQSRFEMGAIYWVPDTKGCAVFGSLYNPATALSFGLPISSNIETAAFTACFFELGVKVLAKGILSENQVLSGNYSYPLMGNPKIIDPRDDSSRGFTQFARFIGIKRKLFDAIMAKHPRFFADLFQGRFSLAHVDNPHSLVPLTVRHAGPSDETNFFVDVAISLEVRKDQPIAATPESHVLAADLPEAKKGLPFNIQERTLYDLAFSMPDGPPYPLSPHAVYCKSDWDNFGLLHITDLHICRRNEEFRAGLTQRGLGDAAARYANFQDNFKDFIKYANKLYKLGLADAVVATGDLVDYAGENVENNQSAGNYNRFRRIILGTPVVGGAQPSEALKIPIFVTFGNHDYRLHPYDLRADIDLPGSGNDKGINEFSGHNLIESEALALQDGKTPSYGITDISGAGRMLEYDRFDNKYVFFKRFINASLSYIVRLGKHRLVVLDTKFDNGIPDDFDLMTLLNIALGGDDVLSGQFGSGLPDTQKLLAGGAPDSVGFGPDQLNIVRMATQEAGTDGLVIVGMHAPPVGPKGGEYPFYFRETLHPKADPALTNAYVKANKLKGETWFTHGSAFFKVGDTSDGLDQGVIAHGREEFLGICTGKEGRPIDLLLCGHHHDRVEWRIKWNPDAGMHEFYTDFYTENPTRYYHSRNHIEQPQLPKGAPIQVLIDPAAPVTGSITIQRDNTGSGPARVSGVIKTPPYANPLNSTKDNAAAKQWWAEHRPLFIQTSALGPIDPRQRFGHFFKIEPPDKKFRPIFEASTTFNVKNGQTATEQPGAIPQPTFQGFRLVQVKKGVIEAIRYVVLHELRSAGFKQPWEHRIAPGVLDHLINGPVLVADSAQPKPPKPDFTHVSSSVLSGTHVRKAE